MLRNTLQRHFREMATRKTRTHSGRLRISTSIYFLLYIYISRRFPTKEMCLSGQGQTPYLRNVRREWRDTLFCDEWRFAKAIIGPAFLGRGHRISHSTKDKKKCLNGSQEENRGKITFRPFQKFCHTIFKGRYSHVSILRGRKITNRTTQRTLLASLPVCGTWDNEGQRKKRWSKNATQKRNAKKQKGEAK